MKKEKQLRKWKGGGGDKKRKVRKGEMGKT